MDLGGSDTVQGALDSECRRSSNISVLGSFDRPDFLLVQHLSSRNGHSGESDEASIRGTARMIMDGPKSVRLAGCYV